MPECVNTGESVDVADALDDDDDESETVSVDVPVGTEVDERLVDADEDGDADDVAVKEPVAEVDELAVFEVEDDAERVLESVDFGESVLGKRQTGAGSAVGEAR